MWFTRLLPRGPPLSTSQAALKAGIPGVECDEVSFPKRWFRVAAVLPVALLTACSEQDVSDGIANAIKAALWFMAKMILIAMALMLAFAAALVIGGAFIAIGVRQRKADVLTVVPIAVGTALIAGAWPLVFTQAGLAGVIAPGSTDGASAGPVFGVVLGVLAVVIALIVLLRRRDKNKRPPAAQPNPVAPPPPMPVPVPPGPPAAKSPAPETSSAKNGSRTKKKPATSSKPKTKAKPKAGASKR